ncbi:hypothetical protein BJ165DRAFT_1029496 [Panaeolus papilionaceus]|nr:hypothetical protein BJ165DRAFT_1029496 [Panaeolus papilionaceus]
MSDTEKPVAVEAKETKEITPGAALETDLTKYKVAADIVRDVTKKLIELVVEGAKILDLCVEGDKLIEASTAAVYNKAVKGVKVLKGIAFPTSISVNNAVAHFSPLE